MSRHWIIARTTVVTLGTAGLGAAAFAFVGLPLPFLLGPVMATALLRLKFPAGVPGGLRDAALLGLGVHIGSSLTPEAAGRLAQLPFAALALVMTTLAVMATGYTVYRVFARWDAETAFLASAPGALSTVLALTDSHRVDAGRVTLAQSLRLCALVFLFPILFPAPTAALSFPTFDGREAALVFAAAIAAGAVLAWRRVPAAWVLGPAASTASLSVTGVVSGDLPPALLATAFLIIGAVTGARIGAAPPRAWRRDAWAAGLAFVVMMAVSAAGALATAVLFELPPSAMLLAFAPGGFEAMVALAAALDIDPALVGAAHVMRVLALTLALPWAHAVFVGKHSVG